MNVLVMPLEFLLVGFEIRSLPSLLASRDLKCLLDMRPVNMPLQFWKRPCRFWHKAVNLTIFLQFKGLPGGEGT